MIGEPVPGAYGDQQTATVTGLVPGTDYQLAVRAIDAAGNAASLSGVLKVTTPASDWLVQRVDTNGNAGAINVKADFVKVWQAR